MSISGHFPQFSQLDIFDKPKKKKKGIRNGRSYRHFNQNEFHSELKKVAWFSHLKNKNTNNCTEASFQTIDHLLDEMAPVRRISRKDIYLLERPWIINGILKSMYDRDKKYKEFVKENDVTKKKEIYDLYKAKRDITLAPIRKSKADYYAKILKNTNQALKNMGGYL